jgi:hypothetical protein
MRALYIVLALCFFTTPTLAAPITATFDLVASRFRPAGASVDPVRLNFTVTFDPTQIVLPTSVGLQINSINLPFDASRPIQFAFQSTGALSIGTFLSSDGGFGVVGARKDFGTFISNALDAPRVRLFSYTQATNITYTSSDIRGTEVAEINGTEIKKEIEAVPEPSTILILAFSLIGLATLHRRKIASLRSQ